MPMDTHGRIWLFSEGRDTLSQQHVVRWATNSTGSSSMTGGCLLPARRRGWLPTPSGVSTMVVATGWGLSAMGSKMEFRLDHAFWRSWRYRMDEYRYSTRLLQYVRRDANLFNARNREPPTSIRCYRAGSLRTEQTSTYEAGYARKTRSRQPLRTLRLSTQHDGEWDD